MNSVTQRGFETAYGGDVAPEVFRHAANRKQVLQYTGNVSGRERMAHLNRRAFPCAVIGYDQQLQLATLFGPIGHKVVKPDVVDPLSSMADAAVLTVPRAIGHHASLR